MGSEINAEKSCMKIVLEKMNSSQKGSILIFYECGIIIKYDFFFEIGLSWKN